MDQTFSGFYLSLVATVIDEMCNYRSRPNDGSAMVINIIKVEGAEMF
jgi:hypothetical protein